MGNQQIKENILFQIDKCCWKIFLQVLFEYLQDQDKDRVKRVIDIDLKMKKLEIEQLNKAYN